MSPAAGRNIYALDPYRMPAQAAEARGYAAGESILKAHRDSKTNDGAYPETVAVNLWGLDSIKTKGESVALVIWLVGARPVREGTGRIARFELLPLEQLGRPRIDVLCNMSGIFRYVLSALCPCSWCTKFPCICLQHVRDVGMHRCLWSQTGLSGMHRRLVLLWFSASRAVHRGF
jgi:hypothetical protein